MLLKFLTKISEGHPTGRMLGRPALFALLFTAIFFTSAYGQIAPPDDSKIEERFPLPPADQAKDGKGLDIYVDGSMSMRGYVSSPASNYCRTIREVVQSATIAEFDLQVYKFATGVSTITQLPLNQLQSAAFYNGRDTPLAAILSRVAESPARSAIIITDLVQSQRGTDSLVLAQALGHLSGRVREIKLLAYRSTFEGSYSPESRHTLPVTLAATQTLPDAGRPFYLLVVAPDAPSMRRLDSYLLSRVPPTEMIHPTEPVVSVETIDLIAHRAGDLPWRLYKKPEQKEGRVRRIISAYRLTRANGPEEILPLDVRMHSGIPIRSLALLSYETTRFIWKGPGPSDQISQVDMPVTATFGKDKENVQLNVRLQAPAPGTWDIYMIRVRPGPGNLDVPPWVETWSTDDDSIAINGNRTFQLKLIVQAMINSIAEGSVFLEFVLEVGR